MGTCRGFIGDHRRYPACSHNQLDMIWCESFPPFLLKSTSKSTPFKKPSFLVVPAADLGQSIRHHLQLRIVGHARPAVQLPGALQDVGGGHGPHLARRSSFKDGLGGGVHRLVPQELDGCSRRENHMKIRMMTGGPLWNGVSTMWLSSQHGNLMTDDYMMAQNPYW